MSTAAQRAVIEADDCRGGDEIYQVIADDPYVFFHQKFFVARPGVCRGGRGPRGDPQALLRRQFLPLLLLAPNAMTIEADAVRLSLVA